MIFSHLHKYSILKLLFFLPLYLHATNYYIDNTGFDTNSGSSITTPWKSINKVNSFLFQPGDSIFFKKNQLFEGNISPISSGNALQKIYFGAYGVGNNPIISGTNEFINQSWSNAGGGKWYTTVTNVVNSVNLVLFNNAFGWRKTSISSLSTPGDFYWDSTNQLLYVYANSSPASFYSSVRIAKGLAVINTNNQSHLTFENLDIQGGQGYNDQAVRPGAGVEITPQSSYIKLQNNSISLCHGGGIKVLGSAHCTIKNNMIGNIISYDVGTCGDAILLQWDANNNAIIPLDILIEGNTTFGFIDRQGIASVNGNQIVVKDNIITHNSNDGYGIGFEPNDNSGNKVINSTIINNIIDADLNTGIAVSGDISYNVIVTGNTIKLRDKLGTIGISFTDFGVNLPSYTSSHFASIKNNYIEGSERGIRLGTCLSSRTVDVFNNFIKEAPNFHTIGIHVRLGVKSLIYNNIIVGFDYAFEIRNNTTLASLFHNVCYNYRQNGIYGRDLSTTIAKNNLMVSQNLSSNGYHIVQQSPAIINLNANSYLPSGNLYRFNGTNYNLTSIQTILSKEIQGREENPLFVNSSGSFSEANDFKLSQFSPAIDSAEDVNIVVDRENISRFDCTDIANTGIIGNHQIAFSDRGAFECFCLPTIYWNQQGWSNTTGPLINNNAILQYPYNSQINGSFQCYDLMVEENQVLTISSNNSVTVSNAITNNGVVNIEDNASLVQQNENNANSGTGIYNVSRKSRFYNEYDYNYWSSPIENATFSSVFDDNSLLLAGVGSNHSPLNYIFYANPANFLDANQDGWDDNSDFWQNASGFLLPTKGYIAMGAGADFPFNPSTIESNLQQQITFVGNKINNGQLNCVLQDDIDPNTIFASNLIGNPYPSAIDIMQVHQDPVNNPGGIPILGNTAYFWSHDTVISAGGGPWAYNYTSADYAVLNLASGIGVQAHSDNFNSPTPSRYVASAQGFVVEYNSLSQVNHLTFKNAHRVNDNNFNFFSQPISNSFKINLTSNDGIFRQIAFYFNSEAADTFDKYDSKRKLYNDPDFYSFASNSEEELVINGCADFDINKTIDLGLKNIPLTTITFTLSQADGIFSNGQEVFVWDKYLNIIHPISQSSYTFNNISSLPINDRFTLLFDVSLSNVDNLNSRISFYPNPSKGKINIQGLTNLNTKFNFYTIYNQKIFSGEINNNQILLPDEIVSGVYFIEFIIENNSVVKKILIDKY